MDSQVNIGGIGSSTKGPQFKRRSHSSCGYNTRRRSNSKGKRNAGNIPKSFLTREEEVMVMQWEKGLRESKMAHTQSKVDDHRNSALHFTSSKTGQSS